MIGDAVNGTRVHEACFKQPSCSDCGQNLKEYLEKNGKLFCPGCFEKNFPNVVVKAVGRQDDIYKVNANEKAKRIQRQIVACSGCAKTIEPDQHFRTVLDAAFHDQCFKCAKCNKILQGSLSLVSPKGTFTARQAKPYCDDCVRPAQKIVGVCYGCNDNITGESMTVLGKLYHVGCFKCENCAVGFVDVSNFVRKEFPWSVGQNIAICANCHSGAMHADQAIEKLMTNQPNLTTYFQFWSSFKGFRPLHKQAEKVVSYLLDQYKNVPVPTKGLIVELLALLLSAFPSTFAPAVKSYLQALPGTLDLTPLVGASEKAAASWFVNRIVSQFPFLDLKIAADFGKSPVSSQYNPRLLTEENLHHDQKELHLYNQNSPNLAAHDQKAQLTNQRPATHADWSAPAHWGENPDKPELSPVGWAPKAGLTAAPGLKKCQKCTAIVPPPGKFCVSCGTAVAADAAPVIKQIFCTGCGIPMQKTTKFCVQCGVVNPSFEEVKQAPLVGAAPVPAWKKNLAAKPKSDKM